MTFAMAHRGLSSQYPENTMIAFKAAANAGFRCIELDLRRTVDHEVVVIHDAGIDRTTDGNGRVADMKYDELRTYDTGEGPVPRFDDVVAALEAWPGHWNIEMKDWHATRQALEIAAHHEILGRAMLSSMDPRALVAARESHPEVPRGLIVLGPPDEDDVQVAADTGCTWLMPDADFLGPQSRAILDEAGLRLAAWTVNDPERAETLVDSGIDAIITDHAEVLQVAPGEPGF